jgi:hypothetical protein
MTPNLWQTTKDQLISIRSIFVILIIAFLYFLLPILLLNYRLIYQTELGKNLLYYKLQIPLELLKGSATSLSANDFFLSVLISLLVGMNVLLINRSLRMLTQQRGKISLSFGGGAILGVVSTGCLSCGFSIISLLGLSASLSLIPFGGILLRTTSFIFLFLSSIYSLNAINQSLACDIRKS